MTTPDQRHVNIKMASPGERLRLATIELQCCAAPDALLEAVCEQAEALIASAQERLETEFATELDYLPWHEHGCGLDIATVPADTLGRCRCIDAALSLADAILAVAA